MKLIVRIILIIFYCKLYSQPNYTKTWATYYTDENIKIFNSAIDGQGNIYIVGKAFFKNTGIYNDATPNAHQVNYAGGISDAFLAKFNQDGERVWSTYFGGANSDSFEAISIDKYNNIYCIGGTKSTEGIASTNAYQTELRGESDALIVKFSPGGSVIWSTYFGGYSEEQFEDDAGNYVYTYKTIVNSGDNHFYFNLYTNSEELATPNVFQSNRNDANGLIAKFTDTGNLVWASYYGTNSSNIDSIDIGNTGIFVYGTSNDCPPFYEFNSYFATPNCHQPIPGSCRDTFLTKFKFDGQREWSTYYGGQAGELLDGNNISCDNGFVYISGFTGSSINITTPNTFQPSKTSNHTVNYLVKFAEDGNRMWGTYVGENPMPNQSSNESSRVIAYDNKIWIYGLTVLHENIGTLNSIQPNINGPSDGYLVQINSDGQRDWGTYFGGESIDKIYKVLINNETIFLVGRTESATNISTPDAYQTNYIGEGSGLPRRIDNTFLARLDPNPLSVEQFDSNAIYLFPNPNHGEFSVYSNSFKIETIQVYDILGKQVQQQKCFENTIQISGLSQGLYLVKITLDNQIEFTKKISVK